ncbi:Conserved DNA-binding protein YbaB [Amycolatopsis xylanica]|uniref:Conserved DNA-binding protein YbaB n=1 Tax=Amycolatopsis xylanica TaxID=589385 RepID=A0A1H3K7K5_9PSEU|nr:YbaB/EbfC family nucleoid-associated protein [Amycolatopsis xylanica]SDY47735.1 Conserved DNA-binding protein YbaB [Amycolatopsis xylanica]
MTEKRNPAPSAKPDRAAMVAALSALSVDSASPDGAVAVSVNTDGVMTSLRLSDAIRRMSPDEIADLVVRTYVDAQRKSAERSAELMRPLGNAGYLADRLRWRLQFEPSTQAVERPAPAEKAILRDRSADGPPRPSNKAPETDDEWYDKGVRFDPAW